MEPASRSAPDRRIRVVHVLPFLDVGGVEVRRAAVGAQVRAARELRECFEFQFCALGTGGAVADELRGLGYDVTILKRNPHPANWAATIALTRWLRRIAPDVVHSAAFEANVHAALARRLARVPVAVSEEIGVPEQRPTWARALDGLAHRKSTCVVAASGSVKAYLVEREGVPEERVRVIYGCAAVMPVARDNGVVTRAELGCPNDAWVVGCVGRLVREKAYDVLLEAFARVIQEERRAHLVIVGDGPEKEALARLAGALGVGDRVNFLGKRRDVGRLLPAFDVFALASDTEGLPVALLEAMLAGVPVVATAVGGVPEVVHDGETGILAPPRDSAGLASGILSCAKNPARAQEMAARARPEVADRFSAGRYVHELVELYRSLLDSHGVARFRDR